MSAWAVIGDGAWGRALARRLASQEHPVHLVGEKPYRRKLAKGITHGIDAGAALAAAERVLIALPVAALEPALCAMAPMLTGAHRVLTTSRGLTPEGHRRASEAVLELTCVRQVAVIAGAADAAALKNRQAAALVVGSAFPTWAAEIQAALKDARLRVYTNPDPVGVELANALAPLLGVAMGAARAMQVGAATEATALTRATAEIARLVEGIGGQAQTAYGLAGLGVLTTLVFQASGDAFENGVQLVEGGAEPHPARTELSALATTLAAAARRRHLRAPMLDAVAALLAGTAEPKAVLGALMGRAARAE